MCLCTKLLIVTRQKHASSTELAEYVRKTLPESPNDSLGIQQSQGENIRKFPIGATLVITAALISDEFVEVIRRLLQSGHKIVVLYVADGNCHEMPEGVILYEIGQYFQRMEMSGEFASG